MEIQTSTKEKGKAFEKVRIPEDVYIAEFVGDKDVSDGEYGARMILVFNIPEKNVELAYICYKREATKDNKLGQALLAMGQKLDGSKIETSKLIGTKVKIFVEDYETKDVDDKGNKMMASGISKVKPLVEQVK